MIFLNDAEEAALLEDLRAIPGTQDIIAALTLAKRQPDLWRMTWPQHPRPPSNWREMPARRMKDSDCKPTLEYAYVCR